MHKPPIPGQSYARQAIEKLARAKKDFHRAAKRLREAAITFENNVNDPGEVQDLIGLLADVNRYSHRFDGKEV